MIQLSSNETQFLIWAVICLLGILGFIGALAVKALMSLAKDVNEIKVSIREVATKHEDLEQRVERIENKLIYN
jgi:F0F1-type ATP synthase membrane subunit b/b'